MATCVQLAAAALLVLWCAHCGIADEQPAPQLTQIDVLARRQLARGVDSYIYKVTHASVAVNDEAMLRWNTPICPLISGLPREMGQSLFDHLNRSARSAGRAAARAAVRIF